LLLLLLLLLVLEARGGRKEEGKVVEGVASSFPSSFTSFFLRFSSWLPFLKTERGE